MLRKLVAAIIIAAASLSSAFASEGKHWKTFYPNHKSATYGCYSYVKYEETILKTKVTNGHISMVLSVKRYMPKTSVTIDVDGAKYSMKVEKHRNDEGWTDVLFSSASPDLYWSLIKGSSMIIHTDRSYWFGMVGSAKAIRTCLKGPEPRKTYASPHRETPGTLRLVKLDYKSEEGDDIYMLKGVIDIYADKRLEHMLKAIPYGSRVFLDSVGGSIVVAGLIGRMLEDRNVETAVFYEDRCASACAIIFAYGVDRLVWEGSKIGLHRVSYKGTDVERDVAMKYVQEIAGILLGLFERKGIDSKVLMKMLDTPAESMYWMPHDEARRLGLATSLVGS